MAFEGLKEQLKEQWADLSSKIQENTTFNNLREKFEAQTPAAQKAIIAGAGIFFTLFLFSFPWSYIEESQTFMAEFEDNRGLIQGLLRASRAAKEPSPLPPPMTTDMIRGRVDMVVKDNRLIADQIGDIQALPDKPAKDLAPAVVIQTGLAVQLKKLNVDQIMNLSNAFHNMGPGIKLMGIDIVQSAGQTHYYDMIVRIVNFALPPMTAMEEGGDGKKGKNDKKKPSRKTEEETGE